MGIVIDFRSRDAAESSRGPVAAERQGTAQVVILPVIRIERYEEQPSGTFKSGREHGRKRRRRASRS